MSKLPVVTLSPGPRDPEGLFPDFANGQYVGGQVRMEAAIKLAASHPLILVGGYNETGDLYASRKIRDMASFLSRYAPQTELTLLPTLPCTRHNFIGLFNTLARHKEGVPNKIGILTNEYHLPRAVALARQAWRIARQTRPLQIVQFAAEGVLERNIEDIVRDREGEYQARVASEQAGLQHLKAGAYQDACFAEERSNRLWFIMQKYPGRLLAPKEIPLIWDEQ